MYLDIETYLVVIPDTLLIMSLKKNKNNVTCQERKLAGDIYINNLLSDLSTAENEGVELQKEFDWILTLPPSAFASKEMLDWLRRDSGQGAGDDGDTDSELGLELSCDSVVRSRTVLLPDQVHPSPPDQAR